MRAMFVVMIIWNYNGGQPITIDMWNLEKCRSVAAEINSQRAGAHAVCFENNQ